MQQLNETEIAAVGGGLTILPLPCWPCFPGPIICPPPVEPIELAY